jgi:hypothetical protein
MEEQQVKQYYNQIEEEDEFEIEEDEEEVFTLDFEKGIAIQQGVIMGEGLLENVAQQLNKKVVAKGMVTAYESTETPVFTNVVEAPEGYEDAAREAEEREQAEPKIKEGQLVVHAVAPTPTYRDTLATLFVDTLTSKAIASLIEKHRDLEKDVYDNITSNKKHQSMGKVIHAHEQVILDSIDAKTRELRKSYGFSGRVSHEHIPEWAKAYIEDYIKNFVHEIASLMGDIN